MIFLIPARAGSKRLPGKNVRPFCGLPLWMWSLATARRVAGPGELVVVSTDDSVIIAQAQALGVCVHYRSEALASDTATSLAVVEDVLAVYPEADRVVLLQPTSPDRRDEDVRHALQVSSAVPVSFYGADAALEATGSVYVYVRNALPNADWTNALAVYAPASDIDTEADFLACEQAMSQRLNADP